jgi:hypothetical protein
MYAPKKLAVTNINVNRNTKNIEIQRVTKDMEGRYVVTATNPYGSVTDYFDLRVTERKLLFYFCCCCYFELLIFCFNLK